MSVTVRWTIDEGELETALEVVPEDRRGMLIATDRQPFLIEGELELRLEAVTRSRGDALGPERRVTWWVLSLDEGAIVVRSESRPSPTRPDHVERSLVSWRAPSWVTSLASRLSRREGVAALDRLLGAGLEPFVFRKLWSETREASVHVMRDLPMTRLGPSARERVHRALGILAHKVEEIAELVSERGREPEVIAPSSFAPRALLSWRSSEHASELHVRLTGTLEVLGEERVALLDWVQELPSQAPEAEPPLEPPLHRSVLVRLAPHGKPEAEARLAHASDAGYRSWELPLEGDLRNFS